MLGIVIVNSSNEILHSFGNSGFVDHVQSLVCHNLVEITSTNKFYSSSSGISSCESSVNKDAAYVAKVGKCDDSALLDMILPLLAMYQSKKDASDNEYSFVYGDNCKYFFEEYDPSHFIIGIAGETYSENEVEQLVFNVKHLLEFYYGPFIHFLRADLSSVKRKKNRVEKRVNALIQQVDQGILKYPMLNINALLANADHFRGYTTFFRKIVQEIGNSIGACRCLFVSGGQILASASTRTKHNIPLYDLIDPTDINNLILLSQMLENSNNKDEGSTRKRLQHHIEQVWVHFPKAGHRRQLVNAFLFSLTGEIDLICVSAVDHGKEIHVLSDLVDLLETSESVTHAAPFVDKCANLVEMICRDLAHFIPKYACKEGQLVFLENSQRTVTLIKNLWGRLRLEILRPSTEDIRMSRKPSMMTLWSSSQSPMSTIHRWSSTASLFSSVSSQQSSSVIKEMEPDTLKTILPVQTHAMIKHFQRQLRFVLNELCLHSMISAKLDKFKMAENGMQKAMDKNSNKSLVPLFNATARHLFDSASIAPVKLGYDMLGYVFYRLDAPFNLSSYPDAFARLFLHAQSSPILSELTIVRLESGHLFVQIMGKAPENTSNSSKRVKKPTTPKDASVFDVPVSCCAVFPEIVNTQLAIKQTMDLASKFNLRVDKIMLMFE
uniref:Folliculin n=1 Tax=Panagrellus redivivus TaxID=6233 RepID=A0A7E5A0Y4_PANRE